MIIQHNTGKAELCFVKVPENASDLVLPKIGIVDLYFHLNNGEYASIEIPQANWQIVGDPFELIEQECRCIVKEVDHPHDYQYVDYEHPEKLYLTAKRSMESLLDHLQIYQTNPLGRQPEFVFDYYGKSPIEFARFEKDMFDWHSAEERTGNWILLIKTT